MKAAERESDNPVNCPVIFDDTLELKRTLKYLVRTKKREKN